MRGTRPFNLWSIFQWRFNDFADLNLLMPHMAVSNLFGYVGLGNKTDQGNFFLKTSRRRRDDVAKTSRRRRRSIKFPWCTFLMNLVDGYKIDMAI